VPHPGTAVLPGCHQPGTVAQDIVVRPEGGVGHSLGSEFGDRLAGRRVPQQCFAVRIDCDQPAAIPAEGDLADALAEREDGLVLANGPDTHHPVLTECDHALAVRAKGGIDNALLRKPDVHQLWTAIQDRADPQTVYLYPLWVAIGLGIGLI